MPRAKQRVRLCQNCQTEYELGVDSTQHKYCSEKCRTSWHYNKWKSSGGFRNKDSARKYWLKHKYGLTLEDFSWLFEQQESCCAICKRDEPTGSGWHVDHDHGSGAIRGILCQKCNQALGLLDDKINSLKEAVKYLENFSNGSNSH